MANERGAVLLQDPNGSEFLGFGPEELELRSSNNSLKKKENKKGKNLQKLTRQRQLIQRVVMSPGHRRSRQNNQKNAVLLKKMIDSLTDNEITCMQLRSIRALMIAMQMRRIFNIYLGTVWKICQFAY